MYVQYNCDFQGKLNEQQKNGLWVASTAIIVCIFYRCVLYFLRTTASINYKLWDINTVTAADFTIEIDIPEIIWKKWNKRKMKVSFK